MNSTPPEANSEYSRGPEASRGGFGAESTVLLGVLIGGGLAALLLIIAEFTTLYEVRTSAASSVFATVSGGSNHSYAMIPIALLAVFLAVGVWRVASRPALLALGVLGVIALLISLLGDLPNAHATGEVVRVAGGRFAIANSSPSAGFYMETLAAVLLLITCVSAFLMLGAPRPASEERRRPDPAV